MRAGKFGDAVPENAAVFLHGLQISERQILNPLRIKVHFIAILVGETVEQFGDGALVPCWRSMNGEMMAMRKLHSRKRTGRIALARGNFYRQRLTVSGPPANCSSGHHG